jgi:ABC-type sugar transport system substrate-binding protein
MQGTKEKTAGLFLLTRQNDYQRLQETAAVAAARRLGIRLSVHFSENDARVQTEQVYAFVHDQPSGSVVIAEAVSDATLEQAARHAARAGIGWIALNRTVAYLNTLRLEFPSLAFGVVTADQKEIGRIQGRQFEALLRGKGTVLYVSGPVGASAAVDRLAGVKEMIDGSAIKYHVVHGDWTERGGELAVAGFFRGAGVNASIQAVGCQNDAMAAGALRALSAISNRPDLARMQVTGVDGNPNYGVPMVDRNRIAATVVMPAVAGQAVELVHESWQTGTSPPAMLQLPVRPYPEIGSLTLRAAR